MVTDAIWSFVGMLAIALDDVEEVVVSHKEKIIPLSNLQRVKNIYRFEDAGVSRPKTARIL